MYSHRWVFSHRTLTLPRHFQPPASCSATWVCFPGWLHLCSLACPTLLPFLCCSLVLSSTSIHASCYGSGHDCLSCTGRLTASASRSPGVLLWQELLVTDISPHLISEWANNNVVFWFVFFFVLFFLTTSSTLCSRKFHIFKSQKLVKR